tara:strand:- start:209 stop:568 length:360 start_codon:yes stop_codon:yes gene_type:complete
MHLKIKLKNNVSEEVYEDYILLFGNYSSFWEEISPNLTSDMKKKYKHKIWYPGTINTDSLLAEKLKDSYSKKYYKKILRRNMSTRIRERALNAKAIYKTLMGLNKMYDDFCFSESGHIT